MSNDEYSRRLEVWEACQRIICREPQQSDPELVANAYLAENANDDLEPADFEWLVTQCERNTSTTHEADGSVWWDRGCVSFECGHVDHDYGEVELIAVEWRVDGEDLPKTLEPKTRGDFRRLCRLANRKQPEPEQEEISVLTADELRARLWLTVKERDGLLAELAEQKRVNVQLAERVAACSEVLGRAAGRGKVCQCSTGERSGPNGCR